MYIISFYYREKLTEITCDNLNIANITIILDKNGIPFKVSDRDGIVDQMFFGFHNYENWIRDESQ